MTIIGTTLRRARIDAGLTITALAESAGMSRPQLSDVEHGKRVPTLQTLRRLAIALETTISVLCEDI